MGWKCHGVGGGGGGCDGDMEDEVDSDDDANADAPPPPPPAVADVAAAAPAAAADAAPDARKLPDAVPPPPAPPSADVPDAEVPDLDVLCNSEGAIIPIAEAVPAEVPLVLLPRPRRPDEATAAAAMAQSLVSCGRLSDLRTDPGRMDPPLPPPPPPPDKLGAVDPLRLAGHLPTPPLLLLSFSEKTQLLLVLWMPATAAASLTMEEAPAPAAVPAASPRDLDCSCPDCRAKSE